MTEQIYGAKWQDSVVALAVENADMELGASETETAIVRVVYGGSVASQRKDNRNFTFAKVSGNASVNNEGVVNAGASGESVISVTLTGYPNVSPAYIHVNVT